MDFGIQLSSFNLYVFEPYWLDPSLQVAGEGSLSSATTLSLHLPVRKLAPAMAAEMFEEHLEQVLFRIPPDDSASHFRAALVSKRWCRLICYPGFCCRFCKFHGTPPLTAFFLTATQASITCHHFVATIMMTTALQSCHGRVTDVVTDELRKLPRCPLPYPDLRIVDCNVVVLCAVLGEGSCDHLDYNHGPFIHGRLRGDLLWWSNILLHLLFPRW